MEFTEYQQQNVKVGKWADHENYLCQQCPFDTLDKAVMADHIETAHPANAPAPDLEVIRRDRFGQVIDPHAPAPAAPVKAEPAPLSKEVPADWDPHQSHEERGLPIPPLNEHAKAAIKKAGGEVPEAPRAARAKAGK